VAKQLNMKKKTLYIAVLVFCMCMFTTASKECGKIIKENASDTIEAKKINAEKECIEKQDGKAEFSLVNLLFFQTT
jgi:hypothetical protein